MLDAQAHAVEIARYLQANQGLTISVPMPVGGNPNRIRWSLELESLAAYEAWTARTRTDAGYMALVGKGSDCYIAGSIFDEFWRTA